MHCYENTTFSLVCYKLCDQSATTRQNGGWWVGREGERIPASAPEDACMFFVVTCRLMPSRVFSMYLWTELVAAGKWMVPSAPPTSCLELPLTGMYVHSSHEGSYLSQVCMSIALMRGSGATSHRYVCP